LSSSSDRGAGSERSPAGKTFIIPGSLSQLPWLGTVLNEAVCGILIHDRISSSDVRASGVVPERFLSRTYTLCSLEELRHERLDSQGEADYARCLSAVCADPRVHYLATRSHLNSAFNNTVLRATRPERLVASSTPHSVQAWIFAKCCEELGLPVFVVERTPINDRAWVYRGLDAQRVVSCDSAPPAELGPSSIKLLTEQRNAKPGARDAQGFYLSRMDLSSIKGADSNAWWSWKRELRFLTAGKIISLPLRLASCYLKGRLWRSYRQSARDLPDGPFVIFFMHYQPERSSLPEGLLFVQQWLALRLLCWALPEGWRLVVREHPSMWLQPLDITVRTADLYQEIATLPNVSLCSMDLDTFEVIDRCRAVATLTGSVGFQAILRNRPVLALGLPAYKDHAACFNVSSLDEMRAALQVIATQSLADRFSDAALISYLKWVEQNSNCVDPTEGDWLKARWKNFEDIYRRVLGGQLVLR
jgi:hypothetical protein